APRRPPGGHPGAPPHRAPEGRRSRPPRARLQPRPALAPPEATSREFPATSDGKLARSRSGAGPLANPIGAWLAVSTHSSRVLIGGCTDAEDDRVRRAGPALARERHEPA